MGSEIGGSHKLPYHVQVHNDQGGAVAGGGGKPQGAPGAAGAPPANAKDAATTGLPPQTPPPGTGPTHHAEKSHHAAGAAPQESVADKKAKGHSTGDEVVVNQQAQVHHQQLLNNPPPVPDDSKSKSIGATHTQQRLTLHMLSGASDIMATLNQVKSEKRLENGHEIKDMMKEIQAEVKKREEFNKKLETVFSSLMGEIGGSQNQGTMCREQLNDKNNELVMRLETELHCTPAQAQALVQGVKDGGAAGTALALSLATMLARKEMQAAGAGAGDGTGSPATGPNGATGNVDDSTANGISAGGGTTTGASGAPGAGETKNADGSTNTGGSANPDDGGAGTSTTQNTAGTTPGGATAGAGNTTTTSGASAADGAGDPAAYDPNDPVGLESSPGAYVASDPNIPADPNAPPPGIDKLVADAKRYDDTTGSLFSGPDQTGAAAMQLMDDAAQGGDGNKDGKGGASGGGDKALLLAGAYLSGATSPQDALEKLKEKDAQEIRDLIKTAKSLVSQMVASSLLTQAVEGSAVHAKDWVHRVFKPELITGAKPPTGLRG